MAEDWLPHEPPPDPPPRNRGARTVAIWLALIALFCAIYWLSSGEPHGPPSAVTLRLGYAGWWIVLAFVAGLALPIALFVWQASGTRAFDDAQRPARAALEQHAYRRAAELFGELVPRYRLKVAHKLVARLNQGYALVRAGDSAAAVGVLLATERGPGRLVGRARTVAAAELARAFAIGGDFDTATRWAAAARSRAGAEPHQRAQWATMEGHVLCRQGQLEAARAHYEEQWPVLEANLTISQMGEAWLLRAFAIAQTSGPRDAAAAEAWLAALRSAPAGSLTWVTARWPELAAYATTQGIAAALPVTSAAA